MLTYWLDAVKSGPAVQETNDWRETTLAADEEELAGLRFSIILAARWAGSTSVDEDRRKELRSDLVILHRRYAQKIDEIAMQFGVQRAMDAKDEVERTVTVPKGTKPPLTSFEHDPLSLWAQGMRRGQTGWSDPYWFD